MWKALLMILTTFYNRVSVSFLEDDCWQFFREESIAAKFLGLEFD